MKILLTGGSACGKSTFAEKLAAEFPPPRTYIATMIPYGDGSEEKVLRHQKQREGKGFNTLERYTDLLGVDLPAGGTVLLECLCNLTANELFEPNAAGADTVTAVLAGIEKLAQRTENIIVVTNDVSSDGASYDKSVMNYIRALGEINKKAADMFDCVCELVCGIPVVLKGELP